MKILSTIMFNRLKKNNNVIHTAAMVWNVNMIVMEISHDIQRYNYNIINQNSRYDVYYLKNYCIYIVIMLWLTKLFIYFNWHHANLKVVFNNLSLSIYIVSLLRISFVFYNVIIVIC